MHHKITLSPHASLGEHDEDIKTTIPMEEGENEYYIVCQNFAGLVNEAPFAVQVRQAEGPDLTPPLITRFAPENNAYLAENATGLELFVYLNEPADCRYSFESYDMNWGSDNISEIIPMSTEQENDEIVISAYQNPVIQNDNENSIPMTCVTDPRLGYYGEWLCAAFVDNYTTNKKIYIECKDQPELVENNYQKRNPVRKEYSAQICETGLKITSIKPSGDIEINASAEINLEVQTQGCINGGDASCSFRLPYYGNIYSLMLNTGNRTHTQPFNSLGEGNREVEVLCEDVAGNSASARTNFTIYVDNEAPRVTRAYIESDRLVIITDESSECLFIKNESIGCEFDFKNSKGTYSTTHSMEVDKKSKETYFLKCIDTKGNLPLDGCTVEIKLSDIQQ
jgi:hypothetical protein